MESDTAPLQGTDELIALRSVLGALAVIAGAFLVYAILGQVALALFGAESTAAIEGRPGPYSVVTAFSSTGFLVAAVAYLAYRDEWEVLHVRRVTRRDVAVVVGGVIALVVANSAMTALVSAILAVLESMFGAAVEFGTHSAIETGERNPSYFLYLIPVSILIVGPGEELVYRGVVQGLFRRVFGVAPAVLVASCLFGLGHLSSVSNGSAWPYVFVTIALGVILGTVYEYTENVVVPAAIHGLWNAGIYAVQWAQATDAVALSI